MTEFAPPTQAEIDRAIALQEAYYADHPLDADKVREAVHRLHTDWQAKGGSFKDVLEFSAHVAETESPTAEDRGEVRALWSYRSQPEGAPHDVEHRFLAQACGESRGYQVLEDTPVGRKLATYELWDQNVQRALVKRYGLNPEDVSQAPWDVWDAASDKYAGAATGQMAVFAAEIDATSILGGTEIPRVVGPGGVGREAVGFPIDFPRQTHLPAEMHGLMADPAVRCDLRMQDYDPKKTSPKEFAAKLATLDVPEHQKEARAAAVAQLSAAASYDELTAPSVQAGRPAIEEPSVAQPELNQPEVKEPTITQPEAKEPAPAQTVPEQPEVKQPTAANAFMPGVAVPRAVTVPARRAATASTHGTINPTIEAAPKATDFER